MKLGGFKRYRTATAKKGTGFTRALIICWTLLCVGSPAEAIEPEHKIGNWFGATSALRFMIAKRVAFVRSERGMRSRWPFDANRLCLSP